MKSKLMALLVAFYSASKLIEKTRKISLAKKPDLLKNYTFLSGRQATSPEFVKILFVCRGILDSTPVSTLFYACQGRGVLIF